MPSVSVSANSVSFSGNASFSSLTPSLSSSSSDLSLSTSVVLEPSTKIKAISGIPSPSVSVSALASSGKASWLFSTPSLSISEEISAGTSSITSSLSLNVEVSVSLPVCSVSVRTISFTSATVLFSGSLGMGKVAGSCCKTSNASLLYTATSSPSTEPSITPSDKSDAKLAIISFVSDSVSPDNSCI